MINNDSGYKFNPETVVTHGTSMGLWLPALDINRTKAGINGIAGMPMVGIPREPQLVHQRRREVINPSLTSLGVDQAI